MEKMSENLGISRGVFGPHAPEFIRERVFDEGVPFVTLAPIVGSVTGWLSVGVVFCVEILGV